MAESLFRPHYTKKYYKGRALILMNKDKYGKQNKYTRKKSQTYHNAIFHKYGGEYGFFRHFLALNDTINYFNDMYGDNLHNRHGVLCLLIKLYLTETQTETFTANDIYTYYPNLDELLGFYAKGHRSFMVLCNDLERLQFIAQPIRAYNATTRLRMFCQIFDQRCKAYFTDETYQK